MSGDRVFEVNLNVNMHQSIDLFVKPEMMEIFCSCY